MSVCECIRTYTTHLRTGLSVTGRLARVLLAGNEGERGGGFLFHLGREHLDLLGALLELHAAGLDSVQLHRGLLVGAKIDDRGRHGLKQPAVPLDQRLL